MHVKPVKAGLSKRYIWDLRDQPTPDAVQYVQSGSTLGEKGEAAVGRGWGAAASWGQALKGDQEDTDGWRQCRRVVRLYKNKMSLPCLPDWVDRKPASRHQPEISLSATGTVVVLQVLSCDGIHSLAGPEPPLEH